MRTYRLLHWGVLSCLIFEVLDLARTLIVHDFDGMSRLQLCFYLGHHMSEVNSPAADPTAGRVPPFCVLMFCGLYHLCSQGVCPCHLILFKLCYLSYHPLTRRDASCLLVLVMNYNTSYSQPSISFSPLLACSSTFRGPQ